MHSAIQSMSEEKPFVLRRDEKVNGYVKRTFHNCSQDDIIDIYTNLNPKHSYHEIVPEGYPVKLFFDIEYTSERLFDYDVIEALYFALAEFMNISPGTLIISDWVVLDACRPNKSSYHLINNDYYFDTNASQKAFINNFINSDSFKNNAILWDDSETPVVDTAVYDNNKSLRMYKMYKVDDKLDEPKYQLLYTGTEDVIPIGKTMLTSVNLKSANMNTLYPDYCIANDKFNAEYNDDFKDVDEEFIQAVLDYNKVPDVSIGIQYNSLIQLNNKGSIRHCLFKTTHKSNRAYLTINGDKVYYRCLSQRCKDKKKELTIPDEYKDKLPTGNTIIQRSPEDIILHTSFQDADFADYVVSKIGHELIYYDNVIYNFNGNYWQKNVSNESIKVYLQGEAYKTLTKFVFDTYQTIDDDKKKTNALKGISKLRNTYTLNNISALVIIHPKVLSYTDPFDLNKDIIAFTNGIYELNTKTFRKAEASDFTSRTTGYAYTNPIDADIAFVTDYLTKVFPIEEERHFMLKYLSSALSGYNVRNYGILTGRGTNAKSTIMEFLHNTLGEDYAKKGNVAVMYESQKSGPNSETANTNKMRLVYFNEADDKNKLKAATLKELTGTQYLNARGLWSNNDKVYNFGTYFIMCNDIPDVDKIDNAVKDRLIICQFRSLFKKPEEMYKYKNEPYLFEADQYYSSTEFQNRYRMAFFHILTSYYHQFVKEKYLIQGIPKTFVERMELYATNCDDFYSWFVDNYQQTDDDNEFVQLKELYNSYKASDLYINLTKAEKRKQTYNRFTEKLLSYPEIRCTHKEIHQFKNDDNKNTKVRNIITNWQFRVEPNDDLVD